MAQEYTYLDFERARVTNPEQSEIVCKRLYDYQLYPLLGTTQLSFFSNPVGQGITSAVGGIIGGPKTFHDTNLEMANTLPSGKAFLIQSVEIDWNPGISATANTFVPAAVSVFAAAATAAVTIAANDMNTISLAGVFELNILSKNYFRDTPIRAFPKKVWLEGSAAVTTTTAAAEVALFMFHTAGRPMYINPGITLQSAVNFNCLLIYPTAVPTPSAFNGRMGIILDGLEMRASQ